MQMAGKAGYKGLAGALKPMASLESAYIKAAQLPVKAAGKALRKIPASLPDIPYFRATGQMRLRKPFEESAQSVIRNFSVHSHNAVTSLEQAGEITGKPLSQILRDFQMGIPDRALLDTITNPKQIAALEHLAKNSKLLGLDELIGVADKNPVTAKAIVGMRQAGLKAKELGLAQPRIATGLIGSVQNVSNKLYSMWRRMVLQTPFYVLQNSVENPIREILVGVRPMWDIMDIVNAPGFKKYPIEVQRLCVGLKDRWHKTIPTYLESPLARTPGEGVLTQALMGNLMGGKTYPATTVASFLDATAMAHTYQAKLGTFYRNLLETNSPETKSVLAKIDGLFDEAIKAVDDKGIAVLDEKLVEHLKGISTTSSVDDILHEFSKISRDKTFTVARAMTSEEAALPDFIKASIKNRLPREWAKNNVKQIEKLFDEMEHTLPQVIETHQKQLLVQRLRTYRDLLRDQIPKQYRPYLTKILNRFKYQKVAEEEARLTSAKSLTAYERAMFKSHLQSRMELETLAEWNLLTDAMANNIPAKTLGQWFVVSDEINNVARVEGLKLADKTFKVADVVRFAKDPTKIQSAWDNYIIEIQSMAPDLADAMRQVAPNNDLLWHTYRGVQEQRWFRVGQDKLRQSGIDLTNMPRAVDASGKVITQEDFLSSQIRTIRSWKGRVIDTWDHRHTRASAKNKLLDTLREETVKAKEGIALQEMMIHNQASDLALDATYTTFGNYAQRSNLDDFMSSMGVPFWFFPSRSIPFYISQSIQRPRLAIEILNLQQSKAESEQPARLFGTVQIPGTDYWINPLQSTMYWQLAGQQSFAPAAVGGLQQGDNWLRNNLNISLGPQWKIASMIVERVMNKNIVTGQLTAEPQPIIPQQRWLDAVGGLDLPVVSPIASILNEPFEMYFRAVYGDTVANWQQREVEKTIVDMGYNPQDPDLPKEVIQQAWKNYYTRQLMSIPGGAVKEMTATELARFEAINEKAKDMGLTLGERAKLRKMGESPFTGLRNDQIEAIYKDIPAQKLWRYIRPSGLTAESKPIWDDYIQYKIGRETLLYGKDKEEPTEGSRLADELKFDKALRTGKISPREWKSLYRQNYADYISRVEQLKTDYPLAPQTEEDWERYRELLGWDAPVRHPDDIKLDEYYEHMDSSKFEDELGMFDFDAYRKAEMEFLSGLSADTIDYIKVRKDKYKTPLRAAYGRDMKKAQPYYDLQDSVLAQYPPEIAVLIEYATRMPDPAIQAQILRMNPMAIIALRRIRLAKAQMRFKDPELDRILRYWSS